MVRIRVSNFLLWQLLIHFELSNMAVFFYKNDLKTGNRAILSIITRLAIGYYSQGHRGHLGIGNYACYGGNARDWSYPILIGA